MYVIYMRYIALSYDDTDSTIYKIEEYIILYKKKKISTKNY